MAYNRKQIFEQAIQEAESKKCFFVEQLISFLPISKFAFYDFFPKGSNEYNSIKEILEKNKVAVKSAMYNKWFKSNAPALQIALMKLIATDEEAHRLNGTKQEIDHTTGGEKISFTPISFINDKDK